MRTLPSIVPREAADRDYIVPTQPARIQEPVRNFQRSGSYFWMTPKCFSKHSELRRSPHRTKGCSS
jgi:hypothetical protein